MADETSNNIKNAGDLFRKRFEQQPTVKLRAGTRFYVMVNADMELYPYNRLTNRR